MQQTEGVAGIPQGDEAGVAGVVDLPDQPKNIVAADRIPLNEHCVAMICGNDYECLIETYFRYCGSHGIGQRDCIRQCAVRVSGVVSKIDTPPLDH